MSRLSFFVCWSIAVGLLVAGCTSRSAPLEVSKKQQESRRAQPQAQTANAPALARSDEKDHGKVEVEAVPAPTITLPLGDLRRQEPMAAAKLSSPRENSQLVFSQPPPISDQLWFPSEPTDRENYAPIESSP